MFVALHPLATFVFVVLRLLYSLFFILRVKQCAKLKTIQFNLVH